MERDGEGWRGMERDGEGWRGMERHGEAWRGMGNLEGARCTEGKDVLHVQPAEKLPAASQLAPSLLAQSVELGEQRGEHRNRHQDVHDGRHLARVRSYCDVAVADGRGGDHAVVEGATVVEALDPTEDARKAELDQREEA